MTRTTKTAAAAAAASVTGITSQEDLDGSSQGFAETLQDEMLELKARVGGIELNISLMREQMDDMKTTMQSSMLELARSIKERSNQVNGSNLDTITLPADRDVVEKELARATLVEKSGKTLVEGRQDTDASSIPTHHPPFGVVYTDLPPKHQFDSELDQERLNGTHMHFHSRVNNHNTYVPPHARPPEHFRHHQAQFKQPDNSFSVSIARPKLDFPTFNGDNPIGWTRQCEKYFDLAAVP